MVSLSNSSGMIVSVALALLPIPKAKCPLERPMVTTRNQRPMVFASSMRFITSSAPSALAVSKPKVGSPSGKRQVVVYGFGDVDEVDVLIPAFL